MPRGQTLEYRPGGHWLQDPVVSPQARDGDDSDAAAGGAGEPALRVQAAGTPVLHFGHHADRAAPLLPHHRSAHRPTRKVSALAPPSA